MLLYTCLILLAESAIIADAAPTQSTPRVVSMPFRRAPKSERNEKRDLCSSGSGEASHNASVLDQDYAYIVTVEIGTPPQSVDCQLDTGSSDLWVYSSYVPGASAPYIFNESASSTYEYKGDIFEISYDGNSGDITGYWSYETVTFAGMTVKHQQFALAADFNSDSSQNIFGIGPQTEESAKTMYNNFPLSLKQDGLIDVCAYSLYTDDLASGAGAIIFGGIDTAKYTGPLVDFSFANTYWEFNVPTTIEGFGGQFSATLDSGTSFMNVPVDVMNAIADKYSATYDPDSEYWFTNEPPSEGMTFYLGDSENGLAIEVAATEIVLPTSSLGGGYGYPYFLGLQSTAQSSGALILGDTFLRSVYVVYNLENQTVSVAQASYATHSSIVPISNGSQ